MNGPELKAELAWVWEVEALTEALDAPLGREHLLWLRACREDEAEIWARLLDLVSEDRRWVHRHWSASLAPYDTVEDLVSERLLYVFFEVKSDGRPPFFDYRGETVKAFRAWLRSVIDRFIGRQIQKYGDRGKLEGENPGAADWATETDPAEWRRADMRFVERVDRGLVQRPPLPSDLLELARWLYVDGTLAGFARLKQITYDRARGVQRRLRSAVRRLGDEGHRRLGLYLEYWTG